MKPSDTIQTNHEVMTCPACGLPITAIAVVKVHLGKPVLNEGAKQVDVPITSELDRFNISHHCQGRIEDVAAPPERETEPEQETEAAEAVDGQVGK